MPRFWLMHPDVHQSLLSLHGGSTLYQELEVQVSNKPQLTPLDKQTNQAT